jgi:hypothetical protein
VGKAALKSGAYNFKSFGPMLAAQSGNDVELLDASNPAALTLIGGGDAGCYGYNLDYADGELDRGLWLPLNSFGVIEIGVSKDGKN